MFSALLVPPMSLVLYCKVLLLTLSIPLALLSTCSLSLELIPRLSVLSTIPTTPLLTSTVLLCFVLKCLQVHIPHLRYSLNETFTASIGHGLFPSSPLLDCGLLISSMLMYLLIGSIPIHLHHLGRATSSVQDFSPLIVASHLCSLECFPFLHATVY